MELQDKKIGMPKLLFKAISKALFIPLIVVMFIFYCCPFAKANEVREIKAVVKDVVSATEEGYISTNKGYYDLPHNGTEIKLENTDFDLLIGNLEKVKGKEAILYIYGDTVIGISSESHKIKFIPKYNKRKKKIYTARPLKISTVLKYWDRDTFRLSIITPDGTFCIHNSFDVSDYYNKVCNKLKERYQERTDLDVKIIIYYHKNESSYECPGEVEDIEF